MGYAQYGRLKSELDLLRTLAEAQDDVDQGRTSPIAGTFSDICENLLARKEI